jgi:hypothetical protein
MPQQLLVLLTGLLLQLQLRQLLLQKLLLQLPVADSSWRAGQGAGVAAGRWRQQQWRCKSTL